MLLLQLWWALLTFNILGSTLEPMDAEHINGVKASGEPSEQLQRFNRAVENAGPELQDLWSSFAAMQELDNQQKQLRKPRNTLDDMITGFAHTPLDASSKTDAEKDMRVWQEEADAWYRSIQAKNKVSGKQERSVIKDDNKAIDSGPSQYNVKTKPQTLGENENIEQESQSQVKAMDVPRKVEALAPVVDGVYESNLSRLTFRHDNANKLDHEANYKLSKVEQEASEKLPKFPSSGSLDARKDDFKQQKRRSSDVFNPMDEIKLKTSCRLMAKGFGPLLPSETYNIARKRKLEDWQALQVDSDQENANKDSRFNTKTFEPQNDNFEYNPYSKGSAMDTDQIDMPQNLEFRAPQSDRFYSPNQRDYENRKLVDLYGSGLWTSSYGAQDKPLEVGKPSALEIEYKTRLKNLQGDEYQKVPEHKFDINSPAKEHELKPKKQLDNKIDEFLLEKAERFFEREAAAIEGRVEDKLKTDLEAAAPASNTNPDAPAKLAANQDDGGGRQPRRTRRVKRSLEEYHQEQQEEHAVTKRKAQLLDDFEDHNGNRASFGVLGNGLLTPDAEELGGKSVSFPGHELLTHYNELETSHDDDSLGGNRMPLHNSNSGANFNDPKENKKYGQAGRRASYLYDQILQTAGEQQKYFKQRQNSQRVLGDERLIKPTKINQKAQFVKKLLRKYHELPLEAQRAATDMLLLDLDYLRKMAGTAVRRQRNALLYELLKQQSLNEPLEKQMTSKHSSRFIKLLKMAELFQELGDEAWNWLAG